MDELLSLAHAIARSKASGQSLNSEEQANKGLGAILSIKEHNRRLAQAADAEIESTVQARASMHSEELEVLHSELQHYQREEHVTRGFKAVQEDTLGLSPKDDFLARNPHARSLSQHDLMKARLLEEHTQRKALLQELQERKAHEAALERQCMSQHNQAEELQGRLQQLAQNAQPLYQVLSPVVPLQGRMDPKAHLLPPPLYVVYTQLVAACEALQEPCSTSIEGDAVEGQQEMRAYVAAGTTVRKPVKVSVGPTELEQQPSLSQLSEEEIYQPHPLRVSVRVLPVQQSQEQQQQSSPPLTTITFYYLPVLRVVTADCQPSSHSPLLSQIFPGDDGNGSSIEALSQLHGGNFRFTPGRVPRPYRWAQKLAGLEQVAPLPQTDPLAQAPKEAQRQQLVVTLLRRVRSLAQA